MECSEIPVKEFFLFLNGMEKITYKQKRPVPLENLYRNKGESFFHHHNLSAEAVEYADNTSATMPHFGCELQPVMLRDGILVA